MSPDAFLKKDLPQKARLGCFEGDELSIRNLKSLSEFLFQRGLEWSCEIFPAQNPENIKEFIESQSEDLFCVRFDPDWSESWVSRTPVLPLKVSRLLAADTFFRREGRWEPVLIYDEALRRALLKMGRGLDVTHAAYLIGSGSRLRCLASVVLSLGFQKIYFVGEDNQDLEKQKAIIERLFVGSACSILPAHKLTMQTTGASLLINSLNLELAPEVAADVAYFNFVRKNGIVIDLGTHQQPQPLIEEALKANLKAISSLDVLGFFESIFFHELGLQARFPEIDYGSHWRQNLTSV